MAVVAVGGDSAGKAAWNHRYSHVGTVWYHAGLGQVTRYGPIDCIGPVARATHPRGRCQLVDGAVAVARQCEGVVAVGTAHRHTVERHRFIASAHIAGVKADRGSGDGFTIGQHSAIGDGCEIRRCHCVARRAIVGLAHRGCQQGHEFGCDGERAIHRHKAVVGCAQATQVARDGVGAYIAGGDGGGGAQRATRNHAARFVVDKACDGLAERGVHRTIVTGLVLGGHG